MRTIGRMLRPPRSLVAALAFFACLALESVTRAQSRPTDIEPAECLVIGPTGLGGGRSAVSTDALEALRVAGTLTRPKDGDVLPMPPGARRGPKTWRKLARGNDGAFSAEELGGGWAWVTIDAPDDAIALLDAAGHAMVYVNGEPRAGDPYSYGFVKLPVQLKKGTNDLLFQVGRGSLRVKLTPVPKPVFMTNADVTQPDPVKGEASRLPVGIVVTNATARAVRLQAQSGDDPSQPRPVYQIPPLTSRKVAFLLEYDGKANDPFDRTFSILDDRGQALDAIKLSFTPKAPSDAHRHTFVSDIDDSVQYYALRRATDAGDFRALVLSLHGAGVEAIGQAQAYAAKPWTHIVCPTNRRPFGFDWEDWGRHDALEVLRDASLRLNADPTRTYLTGHSMGGHGTWQLAVHDTGFFAAAAPSAGWISFATYAAARAASGPTSQATQPTTQPLTVRDLLRRAGLPSDTLAFKENLATLAVYILHGDADDNVPVTEARRMAEELKAFHRDWRIFEQPGAGHWWDAHPEDGADCVDWPPMFDLFAARRRPVGAEVREVRLSTIDFAVQGWVGVEAPIRGGAVARVDLRCDSAGKAVTGTTDNVGRLTITLPNVATITLDGQSIDLSNVKRDIARPWTSLERASTTEPWKVADVIPGPGTPPRRAFATFKQAFGQRMVFVYGTAGTPEENAWAFATARYHAETWWVRGNGSVLLMSDADLDPARLAGRNLILYGNADTNSAWNKVLDGELNVRRGSVGLGTNQAARVIQGDDLTVLAVRPNKLGPPGALVGVVSPTGPAGARLAQRLPIFVSGVHYPDAFVASSAMLTDGAYGVKAAGFFGQDWKLESGELAGQ
jgi:dienelactone hydrolase